MDFMGLNHGLEMFFNIYEGSNDLNIASLEVCIIIQYLTHS